jgi:uncharacterized Zn-finger protein
MIETAQFEKISVNSYDVMCDGGDPAIGHPQIYLQIKPEDGYVTCPYCSRTFHYSPGRR